MSTSILPVATTALRYQLSVASRTNFLLCQRLPGTVTLVVYPTVMSRNWPLESTRPETENSYLVRTVSSMSILMKYQQE